MPHFTIEEQHRKRPVREQQDSRISIPPITHISEPVHTHRIKAKLPTNFNPSK